MPSKSEVNSFQRLNKLGMQRFTGTKAKWDQVAVVCGPIVKYKLPGDTHNAWVSELTDSLGSKIGVELGAPSVSSPGITDAIKIDKTKFSTEITKNNSELNWMDPEHRGYLTLDFNGDQLEARFNFIAELKKLDSTILSTKTFQVLKDNLKISTKRV